MRPRVFPAEDVRLCGIPVEDLCSFNEAAGIPRGRRIVSGVSCRRGRGFNEAAGIPRGRRIEMLEAFRAIEAASMRPRVFPAEDDHHAANLRDSVTASMRPRVFPAEDEI